MLLAETRRDIANVAAGAMVFGQFIGLQTLSYSIAAFGMAVCVALVTFAMVLAGGTLGRRKDRQSHNRAA